MKNIKTILLSGMLLAASGVMTTSCSDLLDLSPVDYYGSGSYWTTEAQVTGYMDGIHKHIRDAADQHIFTFGEQRGGIYKSGTATDGNALYGGGIVLQNFDKNNTGVTNFGGHYGRLANINLFIERVTNADYVGEAKKKYYLAQAYGLRAFIYFELYRIYGGVPLRLDVEVINGIIDPEKLYMARSTPKEVMTQIKKDLDTSMEYFGDVTSFDPYNRGNKKSYWSKAATECLMGEVYLWTSKVTTGDNPANPADLAVAKKHLESVANNYGLKMLSNFADVFDATNKGNSEVIFAIRYAEGEATNGVGNFTYVVQGEVDKKGYRADGTSWNDPLRLNRNGMQWYEYIPELYQLFDEKDERRDATFITSYQKDEDGKLVLWGTHVCKNLGILNAEGNRVYCGDQYFYRLPWVYLSLAEIANMEGDNAGVEKYINLIRQRAYGDSEGVWDTAKYAYKAGDFTQNELAILHEKDKEFVQEGQCWWDIYRMTLTKGGKHLVFCPEANLRNDGNPILPETESYKLLWPIEQNMLDKDPAIKQTPGYEEAEAAK